MLSYLPDSLQHSSLSPLMPHLWLSICRKEQEEFLHCCPQQYVLLFYVEIGPCPFGGLLILVENGAGQEVAFLQASYPHARLVCGFTSTGNNSGGKGSDGWFILPSAVPNTLPSGVRIEAMCQDKVFFGYNVFMLI